MSELPQTDLQVQLTGWAYGGEALGRAEDGRMIFAPFCIPGELVRGEVIEARARWARMVPRVWVNTSPDRLDPRCPHFSDCGGCHYQQLSYELQLSIKHDIVVEQLQRIGGFDDPPVSETLASPLSFEYRNHMRYHVLADGSLGLMRYKSDQPLAISSCSLPEHVLHDLWSRIELPGDQMIRQVGLRTGTSGDPMIILHGSMEHVVELESDFPASIIWQDGDAWRVLAGESTLQYEILDRTFRVSPPSFFQVNTSILPSLIERVMAGLLLEPGMVFFDLYAGVGLFSAFAVGQGVQLYAVEESLAACADFEGNLSSFDDVSLYESSVEIALPAIPTRADSILVDPPRAGLSKAALDAILSQPPDRLVYLSCDLGTFARDAKRLASGGFHLETVTPIDIFPQTYHIETLSTWIRSG